MIKYNKLARKPNLVIFDLDNTLIKPKNTRWYGKWTWMPGMKKVLLNYYSNNTIIILTNQAGWDKRKHILEKVFKEFLQELPKDILLIVANKYNAYRKPNTLAIQKLKLNPRKIHVIGDAAGRICKTNKKIKDFSDSDYTLSLNLQKLFPNISVSFSTPEKELGLYTPKPQVRSIIPNPEPTYKNIKSLETLFKNKKSPVKICGPTKITDYIKNNIENNTCLKLEKSLKPNIIINPEKSVFEHYKIFLARKYQLNDNFVRYYSYNKWLARKKEIKRENYFIVIKFWINPDDYFYWDQYA